MILTYKYRLKGKRSCRQLRRMAWATNQVWNYCVATQRAVQRAWNSGLSPKWPFAIRPAEAHGWDVPRAPPSCTDDPGCLRAVPEIRRAKTRTPSSVTYLRNTYRFFGAKRRPLPETTRGGCFVEDSRGRWWMPGRDRSRSQVPRDSLDRGEG